MMKTCSGYWHNKDHIQICFEGASESCPLCKVLESVQQLDILVNELRAKNIELERKVKGGDLK